MGRDKFLRPMRGALLCGAGIAGIGLLAILPNGDAIAQLGYISGLRLQNATPGTPDVGHANITGTMIAGTVQSPRMYAINGATGANPLYISHDGGNSTAIDINSNAYNNPSKGIDISSNSWTGTGISIALSSNLVSPGTNQTGIAIDLSASDPNSAGRAISIYSSAAGVYCNAYGTEKAAFSGLVGNGTSSSCAGAVGESTANNGNGLVGKANTGTSAYAVWGLSLNGYAVYAAGRLTATGTKAFQIDHPLDPENQLLNHYCAEGPEPMNAYSGNVVTDAQGTAWVTLPDYFEEINRDFRYQLTPIGQFAQAIVAQEIRGNRFQIRTDKPQVKVSWRVEAVRNDRWVREYGAPIEVEKQGKYAGKYLNPELFGQPEERGMAYSERPTSAKTP